MARKYNKDGLCPKCLERPTVLTKNGKRTGFCRECKADVAKAWIEAHPEQHEINLNRALEKSAVRQAEARETKRLLLAQNKGYPPVVQMCFDAAFHLPKQDACIEWPFVRNHLGYGQVWYRRRSTVASRLVLELVLGHALGDGEETNHLCQNRSCINRDHLYAESHSHNMSYAAANGRMNVPHLKTRKLTGDQARLVREMHAAGNTYKDIKLQIPVSITDGVIQNIIRGRTYQDVQIHG